MLKRLLITLRPDQWTKNLVLFAGLLFAGGLGSGTLVLHAASGFLVFCGLSGATYILNDLVDLRQDREHPAKSKRPLASGSLPAPGTAAFGLVLAALSLFWAFRLHPSFGLAASGYLALNVTYCLVLRSVVVLDVMSIAVGFVLRAVGSVEVLRGPAPATELSPWLLVCTFFLALFLGLGKRRSEVLALGENARKHRPTLAHYPPALIDALFGVRHLHHLARDGREGGERQSGVHDPIRRVRRLQIPVSDVRDGGRRAAVQSASLGRSSGSEHTDLGGGGRPHYPHEMTSGAARRESATLPPRRGSVFTGGARADAQDRGVR
jgi:4-hydroxybenzoate polyprenyltransferase